MRHLKTGRILGRTSAHRKALFRNLVTALIQRERIQTTLAKAKELRVKAEKTITLGKKGSLHARRRAVEILREKSAVKKLFGPLAERYATRRGGYTRIIKVGNRRGDDAPMAIIELVDREEEQRAHLVEHADRCVRILDEGIGRADADIRLAADDRLGRDVFGIEEGEFHRNAALLRALHGDQQAEALDAGNVAHGDPHGLAGLGVSAGRQSDDRCRGQTGCGCGFQETALDHVVSSRDMTISIRQQVLQPWPIRILVKSNHRIG